MSCPEHQIADKVFNMALRIEGASVVFYRMAADGATNDEAKKVFSSLEAAEKGHVKIVSTLMKECETYPERMGEVELSAAMAETLGKISESFITDNLEKLPSLYQEARTQNIFELAVNLEKNMVNFYVQVKKVIRGSSATKVVDDIIREENTHIEALRDAMELQA